jgi:glycosyltransferase involved in cell wall biosynthesis
MPRSHVPRIEDYKARAAKSRPLLSVVTTVLNGEKTLARAIASVREQNLPDLEYIVVDAGSADKSLEIIRANADIIAFWTSEPDQGISDGFNKGIALSAGEYILLLNADDWLSPGQLAFGLETLEQSGADFVFGDLIYHDAEGAPLHLVKGDAAYARRIGHVMPALNHPTVIVRRSAYQAHGLFDLGLDNAMDYELLLRLHRAGLKGAYDPRIKGHMTLAGQSDRNDIAALAEVRQASIRHGASPAAAWARFVLRIVKGRSRRLLERLLPRVLYQKLRRKVNPDVADVAR